jgi:hypothetical protein
MKKFLPIIILVALAAAAWFFSTTRDRASKTGETGEGAGVSATSSARAVGGDTGTNQQGENAQGVSSPAADDMDGAVDVGVQPASVAYKSADEALEAVKKGAIDYDDAVLEQFTQPGDDCTWCPEFYKGLREMVSASGVSPDQLSYYSELLAISGRMENIQALVDGIKSPASEEQAQAFAEALELATGKDNIVQFLGEQLSSTDDRLRESAVAAITNQGTRLAAELLYKHTTERGDPDGYYSQGIGLPEFIPDEESMPYLQELVSKRDQYSHLAVKSLFNAGLGGIKMVFNSMSSSKDTDGDRALLKDAIDHINYEEDVERYLEEQANNSKQPAIQEFSRKALEAMRAIETEEMMVDDGAEEDQLQTPLNP